MFGGAEEAESRPATHPRFRLLTEILIAFGEGAPVNLAGLREICQASHGSVLRHVEQFSEAGMIERAEWGRSVVIRPSTILVSRFNDWAEDFLARNGALLTLNSPAQT